jgi:NADH:ubiquinone oxidoreductase subunit
LYFDPTTSSTIIDFKIGNDMAKKNSKRREWTKTDIRELKTLARAKTPAGKIARSLKRTEGATRQKAFALGVSLDSRG